MINTIRNTLLLLVASSVYCFGLTQTTNSSENVDLQSGHYIERLQEIAVPGPVPFTLFISQESKGEHFANGWTIQVKAPSEGSLVLKKEFDDLSRLTKAYIQGPSNDIYSSATLEYTSNQILLTLHDGRTYRFELNNSGQVCTATNPNGDLTWLTYFEDQICEKKCSWGLHLINEISPESGKVILQKAQIERNEPPSLIASYTFEENGASVTSPWGLKKVYTFDEESLTCAYYDSDKLIKVEKTQENEKQIFDSEGKLLYRHEKELGNGKVLSETFYGSDESINFSYTYNARGLLASKVDSEGNKSRYTYNDSNLLESEVYTDNEGNETVQTYRYSDGILVEQVSEDGENILIKTISPSSEPHSLGLPQVIEESLNGTIQKAELFEYTHSGLVTSYVLYDIAKASYSWVQSEYDAAGRECFRADSSGKTFSTHFDDENGIVTVIDQNSSEISESHLNILGKETKKLLRKSGEKELIQKNCYDLRGMLIESIDTLGNRSNFKYDALGNLTEKNLPEVLNARDEAVRYKITYEYDALGRVVKTIDAEGDTIIAKYGLHNKPIRLTYADQTFDEIHYSVSGDLTYMKDRFGKISKPSSKTKNPPLEEQKKGTDSEKPLILNEVDPTSKMLKQTALFQSGLKLISHIDSLGRVQSVEALNENHIPLFHKELRYDGNGLMTKEIITDYLNGALKSIRETSWVYGTCGKLLKKIEGEQTTTYSYNDLGYQAVITRPDGISLHYSYDASGFLQSLKSSDGTIHYSYTYTEGKLTQTFDHIHGNSVTRVFSEEGKLLSEELSSGFGIEHQYDSNGNRIETRFSDGSKVLFDQGSLTRINQEGSVAYSLRKESTEVQTLPGNVGSLHFSKNEVKAPSFTQKKLFAKDKLTGIQEGKNTIPLSYDCLGQLISDGTEKFTYTGTGAINREGNSEFSYTFDALDRLVKAVSSDYEITYTYDGLNRRSSRKVISLETGELLEEESYLYDGKKEIGTTFDGKTIQTLRVESPTFNGQFILENEEGTYSCVKDLRGSVRVVYDIESGDVLERYEYTSFGECAYAKGISPWRFGAKRYDPLTGLVDFGRRDFDPKGARFISKDPAGKLDCINPYVFAQNDPWGKTDLGGLFSISSTLGDITGWCRNLDPIGHIRTKVVDFANQLHGSSKLKLWFGWNEEDSHTGHYGNGELHDRYRITFINGIQTDKSTLIENVDLVSQSHGGCNVHYCYVSTRGWAADLLRAVATKFGAVSSEAQMLAETWRALIQELGGPENGGIIFHYAHSLGGTETLRASYLLTPEERRMIAIITMGSPTLIADDGVFHSVINIISCRDVISIFSPKEFFYSILLGDKSVIFVGSHWDGWPVIDHPFAGYWQHFKDNLWDDIEYLFQ